jgi:hypothetical protein
MEIVNYFNQLSADITTMLEGLNAFFRTSTYYIWISGALLVLITMLVWTLHTKIDQMKKENEKITYQLEQIRETLKGGYKDGSDD